MKNHKNHHAVVNGEYVTGVKFNELAHSLYGSDWEEVLGSLPVSDRGQVDVKMVDGVESGIYEGPTGF